MTKTMKRRLMKVQNRAREQPVNVASTREFIKGNIRAIEGEGNERKFILSFSSEEPYERWYGTEILDHSDTAVDLKRIQEIGCLLFNHNRDEVIGKITKAWIENNRGMAEVEFDTDEKSEIIYQKVKSGTLKGVSVGYNIDAWEEVLANKQSADGKVTGPAFIARKWAPYEISIVSVPADPTVGVGRDLENRKLRTLDWFEIKKNIVNNGEKFNEKEKSKTTEVVTPAGTFECSKKCK